MKITNVLNASGFHIQNLADAVNPQDALTKAQFDAGIQGFKWKDPVEVATTGNITLSGAQTIDGVSVPTGTRVLVKNQTTPKDNGIYVSASGAWTRATDFDAASEVLKATTLVSSGDTLAGSQWHMGAPGPIVIGTTNIPWTKTGGAGVSYNAGTGISMVGNVIAVDSGVVARKATAVIGDGTSTTLTLTHSLGTRNISVSVRESVTNAGVLVDWVANTDNTVQFTFGGTAPSVGQYSVVVTG